MLIIEELQQAYSISKGENIDHWMQRIIIAFLDIKILPLEKSLSQLGGSSLSAAILIDLILKETSVILEIDEVLQKKTISELIQKVQTFQNLKD